MLTAAVPRKASDIMCRPNHAEFQGYAKQKVLWRLSPCPSGGKKLALP